MAIKRVGIVAQPGLFNDEVVTADMLKRMVQFQPRIPLIIGPHPTGGYATPEDWIGTVSTVWNEDKQRVDGEYWFFDEEWHRVPEEVKRKIINYKPVNASQGYNTRTSDDKEQLWRKWDHIALGIPNPLLRDIGVNVRMESEFPDSFRSESAEIGGDDEKARTDEKAEQPKTLELTPAQLQDIIDTAVERALAAREEPPPTTTTVEEDVTERAPEASEEKARPEPEPEMVLPASAPSKRSKKMNGIEETDDGWWIFR